MRSPHRPRRAGLALLALALLAPPGCAPEGTTPFAIPDLRPPRSDRGPAPDARLDLDVGPMADADADPGGGDGPLDGPLPDAAPSPRPVGPEAVVVLPARADTWIAWIAEGALFAVRLDGAGEPGPVRRIAPAPAGFTGPLLGARAAVDAAWVLLPGGPDGALTAYDLTQAEPRPEPMGIWGPAHALSAGRREILVGRGGPAADAPVAWRRISPAGEAPEPLPEADAGVEDAAAGAPEAPDPVRRDARGLHAPAQVGAGLAEYVLGFESGLCAAMLSGDELGDAWPCAAAPGARLVGSTRSLYLVGLRDETLQLWSALPGAVDRSPVPLLPEAAALRWLSPAQAGQLALVEEPEGWHLWWFEFDRIRRSVAPVPPDTLAATYLLQHPGQAALIGFDAAGGLQVSLADLEPLPDGLLPEGPACNNTVILPEDCDGRDLDCDGLPRNGRCCTERGARPTTVRLPARIAPDWFVGTGDSAVLLLTRQGEQAQLRRLTPGLEGAEPQPTVRWDGITRLRAMANDQSRILALAETAGGPQLLWYLGADGLDGAVSPPRGPSQPAPCAAPLGVALREAGGLQARVFCADGAFDLAGRAAEPRPLAYPAGPLRWLRPLPDDGAGPAWLVATGDAHALAAWRWVDDGFAPLELPEALAPLADQPPEARARPIQAPVIPGGWPARTVGPQLEVLLPDGRWWRAPGSRWPLSARISGHDPVALTEGPLDSEGGRITLFAHHLGPDAAFWGRPGVDQDPLRWAREDGQGSALGAFAAGAFRLPISWVMRGTNNAEALGEVLICHPAGP